VDYAEDHHDISVLELNNFKTHRFTSRIYDMSHLDTLILSHNKLTRISPDIQYLVK
jgi:hypothetical protein